MNPWNSLKDQGGDRWTELFPFNRSKSLVCLWYVGFSRRTVIEFTNKGDKDPSTIPL